MAKLNKYDEKQFKSSTKELFSHIEFMIGKNYMLISLDEKTGPRYFAACEELGKKASDVVQAFIQVKTPQYEQRLITQEMMFEIEERKTKFDLINPDRETDLNRFDQRQLEKVSTDFIQNLEVLFGEKFLLVRIEPELKERFYKACERLGKNPYTVVQQLIASKVIDYEERAKQKIAEKQKEERQAQLEKFQQSINDTKTMIQKSEFTKVIQKSSQSQIQTIKKDKS